MPVPFPRGLTEGTSLKHPLLPRLACCTGTCLAQGSNGGNRPPAMTMLPSILKTFNNVKKPDLTQFIKKIYTARAFFTLSSWFTNTPQATWKPEPEAVCPLVLLGPQGLVHSGFFFLIQDILSYHFGFPCAHSVHVSGTLCPQSNQEETTGPSICPRKRNIC